MRFAELAAAYERLEATSKRLEMRALLAELIRPLRPPELTRVLYLSQGALRPEYEGVELGVAASLARRAVAISTGVEEGVVAHRTQQTGDLGTTAAELVGRLRRLEAEDPLTVAAVYRDLERIAAASGPGSQDRKVEILAQLLGRASPLEAKYLVRFVLGTLRVGVREMTLLDALTDSFADGSKEARVKIEAAFNLSSDLGLVAEALVQAGVAGLDHIQLEVGRPIRPMLAEREPTLADILERMGGSMALEYKYDGLRVQAHIAKDGSVRLFSRRLEEISGQFPDLRSALPAAVARLPAILEGECVPIDPNTDEIRPFQEVSRRRGRKHDLDRLQEEVPVCLFVFDILLSGGTPVYELPFPERRRLLEADLRSAERVRLADQRIVHTVEEATQFFEVALAAGAEGVVAKSLAAGQRLPGRGPRVLVDQVQAGLHRGAQRLDRRSGGRRVPRTGSTRREVRGLPPRGLQSGPGPVRVVLQGRERLRRCPAGGNADSASTVRERRAAAGGGHRSHARPVVHSPSGARGPGRGAHLEPRTSRRPGRNPARSRARPPIPAFHGPGPRGQGADPSDDLGRAPRDVPLSGPPGHAGERES